MFTLVLGTAGSGKSRYCLHKVTELAEAGEDSVIVVPEQTGFTYERDLVERLPGTLGARASVMSFRSISRNVLRKCGGSARVSMGDAQKTALARRAVNTRRRELTCYSATREFSFYGMLSSLMDELRSAGATPDLIRSIASGVESGLSREKFSDIAAVMEEYESSMGERFLDEPGEIVLATGKVADSGLFSGKNVFFDAFSGFTAVEMGMIRKIAVCAKHVTVSLCCTGKESDAGTAVAVPAKTADDIRRMSWELFGKAPEEVLMETSDRFGSAGLRSAERYFRSPLIPGDGSTDGITYFTGTDRYDEAERTAEEIVRLVREEGYRYREIAVLFRDADLYREPVTRTFNSFGIPFIFDEGEDLLNAPGTVFMLSAFEMLPRIKTESLLRLLKTGLCDISAEEISLLEDYAFVHGTEGDGWLRPFTMRYSGLGAPQTEEEQKTLSATEVVRKKVTAWLRPYLSASEDDGKDIVRAAYELMERCGAAQAIERRDRAGRENAELMFSVIQQLYDLSDRESISRAELCDTLRVLSASTKSADIPRVGDGTVIGIAGHSRLFNPKVVFVMGLNDGVFPKDVSEGNIFTLEERDILCGHDLMLGNSFDQSTDLESYFLYGAVTSASEKLYLSCAERSSDGNLMPCAELEGFVTALGMEPAKRSRAAGVVNEKTARQVYAQAVSDRDLVLAGSLLASDAGDVCADYDNAVRRREFVIEDSGIAAALAGDVTRITASRMETFEECRFMYFLQYLAGINPLRKAELTPNEAGTFVHDVMENLMKHFEGDLTAHEPQEVERACRRIADGYIESISEGGQRNPRFTVLADQIKDNCVRLARRLRNEQMQSAFRAKEYELDIGRDIPAAVYPLDDGHKAEVHGKVDRIDVYTDAGRTYMRVVDYKTGGKDFDLSDVWQGINVQMLLYLFAVQNNGSGRFGTAPVPAGVLYMPGDPNPASDEKKADKVYTMKGLILDDPGVLEAMEKDGEGIFIPASINGKTGEWDKKSLISMEELGKLERRIEELVTEMGNCVRRGDARAVPAVSVNSERRPCDYCPYRAVCGSDRVTENRMIKNLSRAQMFGGKEEQDG